MNRRNFLQLSGATSLLSTLPILQQPARAHSQPNHPIPPHLKAYADLYRQDPLAASTKWFREARYGLFMHYGIYSLMEEGEWVQYKHRIAQEEYSQLTKSFTAEKFDADYITDVALQAGMKYVTFTSRHHDSFCMFDTKYTSFNSLNTPSKRDFIGELVEQCNQKGLGFFPYYSYGRDWRHPHAPESKPLREMRQNGELLPLSSEQEYNMKIYEEFVNNQITELLTNYGDIAGIWFDAPPEIIENLDTFSPQTTYDLIKKLQPHALISSKWGITGTEGFYAPEFHQFFGFYSSMDQDIPTEICDNLGSGWGWMKKYKCRGIKHLERSLAHAQFWDSNLLLNTGPRPDGSLFPDDVRVLLEMGQRLQSDGFPQPRNYLEHMKERQKTVLLDKCLQIRAQRQGS